MFDEKNLCKAPYMGFVVNPRGNIALCCMSGDFPLASINEVDNLTDYYNTEEFEQYREMFQSDAWRNGKNCRDCQNEPDEDSHRIVVKNKIHSPNLIRDRKLMLEGKKAPIRALEVTSSNICNQNCSTCFPGLSSKWNELAKHLGQSVMPIIKLTDDNLNKIIEAMPSLDRFELKGGEPFADKNNIMLLDKLSQVNNRCTVVIVSNFQTIPDKFMEILKRFGDRLEMSASIDGTNKLYHWIRSSPWEKTISTMEKFYKETNVKITINTCVSIYNFFNLDDIIDYFKDKEYVRWITLNNKVLHPLACNPKYIPYEMLEDKLNEYFIKYGNEDKIDLDVIYNLEYEEPDAVIKSQVLMRLFGIDDYRGFKLFDIVPKLKDIEKEWFNEIN
jgi:radical SAM protein with 4Fe4S-binding SPASM domain